MNTSPGHMRAVLQAVGVSFIWAASWVLIKIGLTSTPPLTFAGLRYTLAFGCLLLIALRSSAFRQQVASLTRHQRRQLIVLGLVLYATAQGAQFAALVFLPSATLGLVLNFTSIAVAVLGTVMLGERPTLNQIIGIGLFLVGVLIYFEPAAGGEGQSIGLLIALVCMLANALGSVLGRGLNRERALLPLVVTTISMGVGGLTLLGAGVIVEGVPVFNWRDTLIIIWLAVVHTAFAFTLWNHTLRTLTAIESSVINSTVLVYIAVLAWIFLGEAISPRGILGLSIAFIAMLVVQFRNLPAVLLRRALSLR